VAQGPHLGRLLAFRRGENLIAVVPRFTMTLAGEWGDTRLPLPGGAWRNLLSTERVIQREISPAELFGSFSGGTADSGFDVIFFRLGS